MKIFTARVSHPSAPIEIVGPCRAAIYAWCEKRIGQRLEVTNVKDYQMIELWDNRAVSVETNTGVVLGRSRL